MSHIQAIEYLTTAPLFERDLKFREAVSALDYRYLKNDEVDLLKNLYFQLKDTALRNLVLKCVCYSNELVLKQFFSSAYKRERYLDMKLMAVRGYANYASEEELNKMMNHFLKILKKRPETTPYNYQEYEFLRAVCGLPYLIKKYGYSCFKDVFEQVEKQYNDMPDAFKGHYTFDEDFNVVRLRTLEQMGKMMEEFFAKNRSK